MQYLYEIIGIQILCQLPFEITVQRESKAFLKAALESKADLYMRFQGVEALPALPVNGHWEDDRYYVESTEEQCVYHCPTRLLPPYACVCWKKDQQGTIICDYIQGKESYLNYSHNLCDLIGLETLLLAYDGLLLHSSFIRWQGKGILFSAPSGTGKSTQADLWVQYENAEILNGDRAGLRHYGNCWTAFGLPLAGSSFIYRNENAPIEAIIALRQADKNQIRQLNPAEAFRYLYPELTVHQWDQCATEKAVSLLLQLLSEVPVYLLECLPDQGAVQLVKETLFNKDLKGG